ncbi:hypothetical protein [Metasolibacillus meyeri]|uniref:hypothetical protein n=1 Tax=Metasolibacillus meyeri TaxID=1071052 RepID=UPI00187D3837|nr:hypothetical protein [Metasolibacillus meyeri]
MKRIIIGILFTICFMAGMWLIDQFMEKSFLIYGAIGLLFLTLYTIHQLFFTKRSY